MDDFGKISSVETLPLPEGQHVKDFDAAQKAAKKADRIAKKVEAASDVTRQVSPNSVLQFIKPSAFQSVADFVDAYTTTDKTIADLTGNFVAATDVAKQKQDEIVPHLACMQSLLSKKGRNHHLVIEARKKGNKIPWWTDYYKKYKDRLWESLRTMERRIDAYRKDPSVPTTKPENGNGKDRPKHLTSLEHKLRGTALNAREVIVDLRAGRIDEAIAKLDKNTPTQDRIAEHLERGVKPTYANPDGDAKFGSDESEPTPDAADQLKRALADEPDRDVASKMLTEHLRAYAVQFASSRIEIKQVAATVVFAGRDGRIMPGDFLEKRKKDSQSDSLAKCTGIGECEARRRVREWLDGKWTKEHVVYGGDESDYRVITEEAARRLAPEAFAGGL